MARAVRPAPGGMAPGIGDIFVAIALAATLYLGVRLAMGAPARLGGPEISLDPSALPYYALRSLLRMSAAYLLSLGFALAYGYIAAHNRRAEAILIPALDILQSVPILSFLPLVVLALIALVPGDLGLELAAVILIFTSQVWNMTFAFYQSLITVPKEMAEAARMLRLNRWLRFRAVELPFATISLVWNSMMSWAGGWFFLMAAEQFQMGNQDFRLPGLGSYLKTAAEDGDLGSLLTGLAILVALIVALHLLVWQPLIVWSDKFNLRMVGQEATARSWVLDLLSRSAILEWLTLHAFSPLAEMADAAFGRLGADGSGAMANGMGRLLRWLGWLSLALATAAVIVGCIMAVQLIARVTAEQWLSIAIGAGATFLRVLAALTLAVAWTLPVGVAIGTSPRLAGRLLPITQVAAAVPATALFPVLLLLFIDVGGGLNLAAVLLMMLGTQWYVLFNVIAGAMAIPEDLQHTTRSLGVRGWDRWRVFILPAIFPYLVTGLITAAGGAWNASIVAEYVVFDGVTYRTTGLGAVIASSSAAAQFPVLLAATLAMIAVVVAINRVIWRRLYLLSETRFRLE